MNALQPIELTVTRKLNLFNCGFGQDHLSMYNILVADVYKEVLEHINTLRLLQCVAVCLWSTFSLLFGREATKACVALGACFIQPLPLLPAWRSAILLPPPKFLQETQPHVWFYREPPKEDQLKGVDSTCPIYLSSVFILLTFCVSLHSYQCAMHDRNEYHQLSDLNK